MQSRTNFWCGGDARGDGGGDGDDVGGPPARGGEGDGEAGEGRGGRQGRQHVQDTRCSPRPGRLLLKLLA